MATIDLNILNAAFDDGLFRRRLSSRQKLYLKPSILTAHEIIQQIDDREDDGIDVEALSQAVGTHANTVKIYCRWLAEKQLIEVFRTNDGIAILYFSVKSHLVRSQKKR